MDITVILPCALVIVATPIVFVAVRPAWVVAHPFAVMAPLVCVSLGAAVALVDLDAFRFRISLDPSEEPLLASGDPARERYDEAIRNFGDDNLFVAAMVTDDLFTHENLLALREAGNAIRRIPGVRAAESLVDTSTYRYVAEDDLVEVGRFIDEIPSSTDRLADLRTRALGDRIYTRSLVSTDGRTAAINVSFRTMTDREFVDAGIDDAIRRVLDVHSGDARRYFVTGRQHIKAQAYRLMVDDLLLLIPLAVVVGAGVARIVSGSLRGAIIPVGASLVASLWTFGALALLGRPLNLITLVLGPTLICVGSVYGVHVLARFDGARDADEGKATMDGHRTRRQVALATMQYTMVPVLIAGVTTCIGFSALLLSPTPAIRELGAFCVLGVATVTMISLTGIPALLCVLPEARRPVRSGHIARLLDGGLARVACWNREHTSVVLGTWAAATALAMVSIPRIVVDSDYLSFFNRDSTVRRDFATISDKLVGAIPIYVTLAGEAEGTFRDPANLRAVERLQASIEEIDGVSTTLSVVDLISVLNRAVERDDPAAERIPDTRAEVAELLFLIPKNRLRRFANVNHSRANILVRTGSSGSAAILELERRIRAAAATADLPATLDIDVTGNTILVNHGADGIARNQLTIVAAAAVAILVLISRTFGSVRLGLLAMIPNLAPICIFFGLLGLGVAPLSLPTSLIGCIALGIAIDDTAHFLVGYRRRRDAGADPLSAADDCVRTLGRPIATTSFMLTAGFLVLSFSEFATLREFGYLSALTMLVCLGADLLLLPAVLIRARI